MVHVIPGFFYVHAEWQSSTNSEHPPRTTWRSCWVKFYTCTSLPGKLLQMNFWTWMVNHEDAHGGAALRAKKFPLLPGARRPFPAQLWATFQQKFSRERWRLLLFHEAQPTDFIQYGGWVPFPSFWWAGRSCCLQICRNQIVWSWSCIGTIKTEAALCHATCIFPLFSDERSLFWNGFFYLKPNLTYTMRLRRSTPVISA